MDRQNAFSITILFFLFISESAAHSHPKIAVIGAGLGGTSVSYFLQDIFGEGNAVIDIYEAHEIGGRLATVDMDDRSYEAGGSVIHPDNKYMAHFCKKFAKNGSFPISFGRGIELPNRLIFARRFGTAVVSKFAEIPRIWQDLQKRPAGVPNSKFALYDGKDIVFSESDWGIITWMKMLWRYGYGPIKLNNIVEKMLNEFKRIYQLQEQGKAYSSVEDMIRAMSPSFVNDVKISSEQGFAQLGLSNRTIDEIVMAGLIVNYGQTTAAHKFVGCVSSAAGDGHLWSVAGGNKQIPEMLLKYSGANLIKAKVVEVTLLRESGKFNLSFEPNGDGLPKSRADDEDVIGSVPETYDVVIIAAPLTSDTNSITFKNFPSSFSIPGGKYHRTVCTFVKGEMNNAYFGMKERDFEVLSIKGNLKFNSVSLIHDVRSLPKTENQKVWKVFSQKPLKDDDLKDLFVKIEEVKVVDWLAYPHYDSNQKLGSFVLHENLYHVNAIEWAASAMEMSLIGAKNVALLMHKDWSGGFLHHNTKDEL